MPNHQNRVGTHTKRAVGELQKEVETIGQKAQQQVHDLGEAARERALGLQEEIEDRITRNPLKSVLFAAGAGMLLGFLFRR